METQISLQEVLINETIHNWYLSYFDAFSASNENRHMYV